MSMTEQIPTPAKVTDQRLYSWPRNRISGIHFWSKAAIRTIRLSSPHRFYETVKILWLLYKVREYTIVSHPRLKALYTLTKKLDFPHVAGDIVECGVYNGGSAAVMAYAAKRSPMKRNIWLFDSFEGMPVPTEKDGTKAFEMFHDRWNAGDVSKVKGIFRDLSIPDARVHIVKGWFHNTFPLVEIPRIALLHIDADWYQSVNACLEKFYDLVQPGGVIVLDDYGLWEGCQRATDEFIERRNLEVKLVPVDYASHYFSKPLNLSAP